MRKRKPAGRREQASDTRFIVTRTSVGRTRPENDKPIGSLGRYVGRTSAKAARSFSVARNNVLLAVCSVVLRDVLIECSFSPR